MPKRPPTEPKTRTSRRRPPVDAAPSDLGGGAKKSAGAKASAKGSGGRKPAKKRRSLTVEADPKRAGTAKRKKPSTKSGNPNGRRPRGNSGGSGSRTRRRRGIFRTLARWSMVAAVWAVIGFTLLVVYYAFDLPDVDKLYEMKRRPEITLVDRAGARLASYGDIYRQAVQLQDLPKYLPQAILATEDRRFYGHFGIDVWGMGRAVVVNVVAGRVRQGGSTITQQLAKNVFLTNERSMKRKIQELLLALWLEHKFSKDQILTMYLNRVYLGAGTHGVDAAAHRYFGKPAKDVSLFQAALLAGLLRAPSRLNPATNTRAAVRRTRVVLAAMVDAGYITKKKAAAALRNKGLVVQSGVGAGNRYFTDWILEQTRESVSIGQRNLKIKTTLSPSLQQLAERHVAQVMDKYAKRRRARQAAMVVMAPDGAILAMVGGRDFRKSQFNRVTRSKRQPGSTFKLFVMLAALERGIKPEDRFRDAPIRVGKWRPHNYRRKYYGDVSLATGMAKSLNSVAIRVGQRVGTRRIISMAQRLGVSSKLNRNLSLTLGASGVTMLEMAAAYATLANGGRRVKPHGIREIATGQGRVLYQRRKRFGVRVLSRKTVADANRILARVLTEEGTGKLARFGHQAAGKTGTTQDSRDAWFIGYTAQFVTVVWVGNDDDSPMKGVTGGSLPALIWRNFMRDAHAGRSRMSLPGMN